MTKLVKQLKVSNYSYNYTPNGQSYPGVRFKIHRVHIGRFRGIRKCSKVNPCDKAEQSLIF